MKGAKEYILTLSCPDATGIVHAVSGLLYQAGCNIVDSQQFGDVDGADATGRFFMRVHFSAPPQLADPATLEALFGHARKQFDMVLHFHARDVRPRVMLMVSQHGHCLNDLLFRVRTGQLAIDVPCVVSNHTTHAELVRGYGIAFHHLPLAAGADAQSKQAQELRVLELAQREKLRAILVGAAEGWLVAKQIAAAGVPAIVDPLDDLPASFDELRARDDNAARLHAAGVRVAFSSLGDAHRVHRLRHAAGNAVARGMPRAAALAAITRVPAEIFDVRDSGVLRAGALADLVIWNGDPLELDSWPLRVFAHGRELELDTRQDELTRRYMH